MGNFNDISVRNVKLVFFFYYIKIGYQEGE